MSEKDIPAFLCDMGQMDVWSVPAEALGGRETDFMWNGVMFWPVAWDKTDENE